MRASAWWLVAGLAAFVLSGVASAQSSFTWNGGSPDTGNWSDTNNWGGAGLSGPQAVLNFVGSARTESTNDFTAGSAGFQILFGAGASPFSLSGSAITFYDYSGTAPLIRNDGTAMQTVGFALVNGNANGANALVLDANAGPLVVDGAISADGGWRVIDLQGNAGQVTRLNGVLQDGGAGATLALTALGSNTTVLTAANTYSGQTTVRGGTLQVGLGAAPSSIGTGAAVVEAAGTLVFFCSNNAVNVNNSIGGTGTLVFKGTGTSLDSGYLIGGTNSGFAGTLYVDGARLTLDNANDVGGTIYVSPTGGLFVTAGTFTAPVYLGGRGWLESSGLLGALRLQGGATWAGSVTLTNDARIGAWNAASGSITGAVGESGGARRLEIYNGTGSFGFITLTASNSYSGGTLVNGPVCLRAASDAALGAAPGAPDPDNLILQSEGRLQAGNTGAGVDLTLNANRGVTLASGNGYLHPWSGYTLTVPGPITGSGNLIKSDGGTAVLQGTCDHTGATTLNAGTLTINQNGRITRSTYFGNNGSNVVFNLQGNAVLNVTDKLILGDASGASITVNQAGGAVTNTGTLNLPATNSVANRWGHWPNSTTVYNLSGGRLDLSAAPLYLSWDGPVTLTVSGTGVADLMGIDMGYSYRTNPSTINLNSGGTLNIGSAGITTGGTTNKTVNLAGGTLGSLASWSSSRPMALSNTSTVNPAAGHEIALSGVLSGSGALVKAGSGTLTLDAADTYTGATTINAGALKLGAAGSLSSTPSITLAAGTTLDVSTPAAYALASGQALRGFGTVVGPVTAASGSAIGPGQGSAVGVLTFSTNLTAASGAAFRFDLNTDASLATNDRAVVNGDLTLNGNAVNFGMLGASTGGTYRLVEYAGVRSGTLALGTGAPRGATFTYDDLNKYVLLTTSGSSTLTWNPMLSGTWDLATTANWTNTAAAVQDVYYDADAVQFTDLGAYMSTVNLATALAPSAVAVYSLSNYVFGGAGKITGYAGIVKSGAGALALNTTNDFTGGLTVLGGVVSGVAAGFGADLQAVTIADGGAIDLTGVNRSANRMDLTIAGAGQGGSGAIFNSGAALIANSGVRNVTLSSNATVTVGGTGAGNRWDVLGTLNLAGWTLTKSGGGNLVIRSTPGSGGTLAAAVGTLALEDNFTGAATSNFAVNVSGGAAVGAYNGKVIQSPVTLNGTNAAIYSQGSAASSWAGPVTLSGGGRIDLSDRVYAWGGDSIWITGVVGGTGQLVVGGANGLKYAVLTGTNTFADGVVVDGAYSVLRVAGDLSLGPVPAAPDADSVILQNGGRLQNGSTGSGLDVTLAQNRGITLASGNGALHAYGGYTLTVPGSISGPGNLYKTDTGTAVLRGTNTYTGGTVLNAGTLTVDQAGSITQTSFINNDAANVTLNIKDSARVNVLGAIVLGDGAASRPMTINQSGGAVACGGELRVAHWPSETSSYNLSGGTLTVGGQLSLGWDGTGYVTVSNATLNVAGNLSVSPHGTANNTLTVQNGASVNAGIMNLCDSSSYPNGIVNQEGGVVTVTNAVGNYFRIAHWSGPSTYNISGGTLRNLNGRISVGWDGSGVLNISGGQVQTPQITVNDNGAGGSGILNLTGGALTLGAGGLTSAGGTCVVNLGGGTLGASAGWSSGVALTLTGTNGNCSVDTGAFAVNLTGVLSGPGGLNKAGANVLILGGANSYAGSTVVSNGTLRIDSSQRLGASPGVIDAAHLVLNGGVLQTTASLALSDGTRGVTLGAAGGTLAPDAGTTLTVSNAIAGGGVLTKSGAGVLLINGVNSCSGATHVAVGRLGGTGSLAGSALSVNAGATLGAGSDAEAIGLAVGGLALNPGARMACPPIGTPTVRATGAFQTAATNWVDVVLTSRALTNGVFPLIDYVGAIGGDGFGALQLSHTYSRGSVTLVNNTNDTTVDLVVSNATGAMNLLWKGVTNTVWDVDVTANWLSVPGGATGTFMNADSVLFDDSAATSGVLLAEAAYPASVTVSNEALNYTLSGQPINGSCSLQKFGGGTLTLAGSNGFTGDLNVNSGRVTTAIQANGQGITSGMGNVAVARSLVANAGGVLAVTINNAFVNNGPVATATLVANAGGTITASRFNAIGPVTLSGGTLENTIPAGTDVNWDGWYFQGPVTVRGSAGSTISSTTARANRLDAVTTFDVADATGDSGADLTVSAPLGNRPNNTGAGSLVKSGIGTMMMTGVSTYTGATTVNGGTLAVVNGGQLYSPGWPAGVMTVNAGGTLVLDNWNLGLMSDYAAGNLVVNGGTVRYTGSETGAPGDVNGAYGRAFTIAANGGTLESAAPSNFVWAITRYNDTGGYPLAALAGALTLSGSGNGYFSKPISGTGGVTKAGAGTWTVSGTNSYSGPTLVSNGVLVLNGSLTNSSVSVSTGATLAGTGVVYGAVSSAGTVSPGASAGLLAFGSYSQGSTGLLVVEIGGTAPGTQYDQLAVAGAAAISGTLQANGINGFEPSPGEVYTVVSAAGGVSGTFSSIAGTPGRGRSWTVAYTANEVRLGVIPTSGAVLRIR